MTTSRRQSSPPKSFAAADAVIAATAGEDSWKTWAGRTHGDATFEWMDIWRGCKRTVEKENVGTEDDPVNKPRDNVKSTRKDIAPYTQGMILTETRQAGIAAASLGTWLLVSYLLVYLNLRSTRPK